MLVPCRFCHNAVDTTATRTKPLRRARMLVLCPMCGDVFEVAAGMSRWSALRAAVRSRVLR